MGKLNMINVIRHRTNQMDELKKVINWTQSKM